MHRRDLIAASASLVFAGSAAAAATTDAAAAQAFHAQRRVAKTAFGEIAYVERGAGPTALFLHGFPLNGFQWRGALERLSSDRRCLAPDFMGLGYTAVAEGQRLDPGAQTDMIAAFLDTLSVRVVDLVSNDSGNAVAQLFVTRHPERVRTLLLTNGDAEPSCPPAALLPVIELARTGAFAAQQLEPWLKDKALARSPQGLGGLCYGDPSHPTDAALAYYLTPLVDTAAHRARTDAFAVALTQNALAGLEPALRRCQAPARIIWGMGDPIFAPDNAVYLDRALPKSRGVRPIPEAKLFFPEEYPDLIAEEARRLWRDA